MVGIDIVQVSRMFNVLKKDGFYNKVLNKEEKEYIEKNKKANDLVELQSLAGVFAGKEAVLKAFGVGITNGYGFKDITIIHNKEGAPVVKLSQALNERLNSFGKSKVFVSISHDGDYATAIAIIE